MNALSVHDLTYQTAGKFLIQDIHFSIPQGCCLGIVGPNGAGKSTLMRLLAGFWQPSSGRVLLQDQALADVPLKSRARQIAVVNPREQLPPFVMSVLDYLKLGRAPYQDWLGSWHREDESALNSAVMACKLQSFLHEKLHNLSSGEWQRVQLGRALCQTSDILLLDEPTSHLDVSAQVEMMHMLWKLSREGKTLVTVVHDLNLAAQYMDTILLLDQGRAVACGSPESVLTQENLGAVYQLKWDIRLHAETGRPLLVPDYHAERTG